MIRNIVYIILYVSSYYMLKENIIVLLSFNILLIPPIVEMYSNDEERVRRLTNVIVSMIIIGIGLWFVLDIPTGFLVGNIIALLLIWMGK